jgi:hypothetical protein
LTAALVERYLWRVLGRCLPHMLLMLASPVFLVACEHRDNWSGSIGVADRASFDRDVYPLLMRDCAYSECHGAPQRFLRILGPGRTRLDLDDPSDSILEQEKQLSYERARSMLFTDGSLPLMQSPLLVKPLELSLGGASHGGVDVYGRNVYRSTSDPGYVTLVAWAMSAAQPNAAGASAPSAGAGP